MSESRTIESLCSVVQSGGTPARKVPENFVGGLIPWIKTMDLSDGPVVSTGECISERGLSSSSAKWIPAGATIIAMYGATVGKLGYTTMAATSNQAACALVSDLSVCDPKWLYYAMLWSRGRLIGLASGAAQQNLNVSMVRAHVVPALPLSEQRVIGDVLGALDDKIATNRTVASSSRTLAATIVTGIAGAVKVGDLARIVRKSIDPSSLDVSSVKHFSLPAFDAGAASDEVPSSIKSAKNLLPEPVVLVSKLNPRIPRIWAVDKLPAELALASTEFVALAPRDAGIGAVWASLLDRRFTQSLLERTAGTTGSHQRVKPEQMLDVEVRNVRELTIEKRELVESLCRKFNDIADENQCLAATRDELLPLLMSGKITVKDAEKTVEEVV